MSSFSTDTSLRSGSSGPSVTELAQTDTARRVASGQAVREAADNSAYWSIATTMKSANLSLSSAEDAQAMSAAIADTASVGLDSATGIMSDIQSKLILAKTPGVDKDGVNREISQLKEQLAAVAQSSSFSGQNWLQSEIGKPPKVQSMVGSVSSNANGDVAINVIDFDTAKSNLVAKGDAADGMLTRSYSGISRSGVAYDYHLLDAGSQTSVSGSSRQIAVSRLTSNEEIDGMLSAVGSMMRGLTDAATSVGATGARINGTADSLQRIMDTADIAVSRLIDTNLREDSARQTAQAAQRQLQVAGLNIANATMASTLQLFK